MTEAESRYESFFYHFDERGGPATPQQLTDCERRIGMKIPDDLKHMYLYSGWGAGFVGPADETVSDDELPGYLSICSPSKLQLRQLHGTGEIVFQFGTDGSTQNLIMFSDGQTAFVDNYSPERDQIWQRENSLFDFLRRAATDPF